MNLQKFKAVTADQLVGEPSLTQWWAEIRDLDGSTTWHGPYPSTTDLHTALRDACLAHEGEYDRELVTHEQPLDWRPPGRLPPKQPSSRSCNRRV